MELTWFRCTACRSMRRQKTSGQSYCSEAGCQKARKNSWRREKYKADPDYRANQRDSTAAWLETRGGAAVYYREYRRRVRQGGGDVSPGGLSAARGAAGDPNGRACTGSTPAAVDQSPPAGADKNRPSVADVSRSSEATAAWSSGVLGANGTPGTATATRAKSDAEMAKNAEFSGRYWLLPVGDANRDAIMVDLSVFTGG